MTLTSVVGVSFGRNKMLSGKTRFEMTVGHMRENNWEAVIDKNLETEGGDLKEEQKKTLCNHPRRDEVSRGELFLKEKISGR